MGKKEIFLSLITSTLVAGVFFYKFFLLGQLPFPGDLLIAEYKPWRSYSILGYNPGSYPNKAQYPDTFKQLYPWKTQVIEQLKSGNLPLWNPHNFSGAPLLANFQSSALYPLSLLYFLFSQPLAWSILVFLQPALSSFFSYWYCRKIGLHPMASALASISFSYGSFMTVWLEYNTIGHVIVWLPLALLAIENRWTLILILSLSLPFFAGHPQIATMVYLFSLIYLRVRTGRLQISVILIPLGISAVQLIPGIELALNSARNAHPYEFFVNNVLIQPQQLIMLVFPDFFGNPATRNYILTDTYIGKVLSIGLVPLFFLPAILRSKNKLKHIFMITAGVILLLATKNPLTILLYRIPQLRTSSPTLFIFLFQLCLAILTGIGLDLFLREPHTIKKLMKRSLLVIILLGLGFLMTRLLGYGTRSLIYGAIFSAAALALFFIGVGKKKYMVLALTILLFIHTADLFYAFQKFNPFVPADLFYPTTAIVTFLKDRAETNRIWGFGTAAIEANFATQLGLYSPEGYDPLYPAWYGEYLTSSKGGKASRSDAQVTPGYGSRDLINNTDRLTLLNNLGVKYILDRVENQTVAPASLTKIYDSDGWIVYENKDAVPRAVLESRTGIVHIDSYTPNRVDLTVSTNAPDTLVLSDTYYPGWIARIDGKKTEVRRANHTMRAVVIPAGSHEVMFSYEPQSVRLGIMITIISILTLAALLWRYEKK